MALATCSSMVADALRLALVDEAHADEMATLAPQCSDPGELARTLARRGWLTVFQLNKLLQNHANDLLLGPYILLERLGEGGMGQVFKARHRSLGRVVAVKIIRKEALTNPTAVRRFEREVQANAQLTHPNVVRAFDAGQAGGTYYLAMEFVEGTDLSLLVKQEGPLAVPRACDYIRQAALGLQHMHERGFIHRDIKPANLLLTHKVVADLGSSSLLPRPGSEAKSWGTIKILDFGLARVQVSDPLHQQVVLTQQGTVMGTPDYLAPEQAWDSQTSDIRADLYSLGCTFYLLLSGEVPFPGGSVPEKLIKQRNAHPKPVGTVRREMWLASHEGQRPENAGEVPPKVEAVLQRLMAKKPADRFQTPAELAQALTQLQPRAVSPSQPVRKGIPTAPLPRSPGKTGRETTSQSCSPERTVVVSPAKAEPKHEATTHFTQPTRWSRLRSLLVYAGFLLCCMLASRSLSSESRTSNLVIGANPAPPVDPPAGEAKPPAPKRPARQTGSSQ